MNPTFCQTRRRSGGLSSLRLLPAGALLLLGASSAQAQTQPISASAGLPAITGAFDHTSVVTLGGTPYDFNYYNFTITGFTNVGAGNPDYGIFSFSNSTLENLPGVEGVLLTYSPDNAWTLSDATDFSISTSKLTGIFPDDPQFGLIFIQSLNTLPIDPTGAPFEVYHQMGAVDPFTLNGAPVTVLVNSPVPEASTTVSLGLLLLLGLGSGAAAAFRKKTA